MIKLKKILIWFSVVLISFSFLSNGMLIQAAEKEISSKSGYGFSYYKIQYNGEKQVLFLNDDITLTLKGWTDDSKTAVSGELSIQLETTTLTKNIQLEVTNEVKEIPIDNQICFNYKLSAEDTIKVERITVEEENENGTFVEKVEVISKDGSETGKIDQNYLKKDSENQSLQITKEEYEILKSNANSSKESQPLMKLATLSSSVATTNPPKVKYSTYVQGIGWQSEVTDGEMSGTTGKNKHIEAIKVSLENATGNIEYRTHVQDFGWLDYVKSGSISGKNKQVEAVQIRLTGDVANQYDIYYRVHTEDYGWLDWAKNGEPSGTQGKGKHVEAVEIKLIKKGGAAPGPTEKPFIGNITVVYSTHVQDYGWLGEVKNGAESGKFGKQIEAIKVSLKNVPYTGGISYSAHVQDIGWQNFVSDGSLGGTTGKNKQMEAIQIKLTGEIAERFDVYYRVNSEGYGWLGWAKNGESAGTQGFARQMEAIQIVLVEKGGKAPGLTEKPFISKPSISYSTHVQDYGWLSEVSNGATSGKIGKQMEAIKISLKNVPYTGGISYSVHVQDIGWQNFVSNGSLGGTTGKNKQLEAIQIKLTDEMEKNFDVYYRVYSEGYGWLGWAKNGESAGTQGFARQMEAIQIVLVEKGGKAPGLTEKSFITKPSISYSTHVQNSGWTNEVKDGAISGTTGQAKPLNGIKVSLNNTVYSGSVTYKTLIKGVGWQNAVSNGQVSGATNINHQIEAIQINLTGEISQKYDVYYRTHVSDIGWLGWAKNGESAGTEDLGKKVEAIQILLVEKGGKVPGSTDKPFMTHPTVSYTTYVQGLGWMNSVANGATSGTIGKNKHVESIKININLQKSPYSGGISYSTHLEDYGWLSSVSNGAESGQAGKGKQMEAIKMELTGTVANYYDLYYRVHVEDYGWLGWAKNGMNAGSEGLGKQIEAIEIKVVPKGQGEDVNPEDAFKSRIIITYNRYNLALKDALDMQMKVAPQTDKYRNDPAYVSKSGVDLSTGMVTGSVVNLRTSPNLGNNVYIQVTSGTTFTILDDNVQGENTLGSSRWFKIKYNDQILYIHSSLATKIAKVNVTALNVRSQPNTNSHIYGTVTNGTTLTVLEEIGDWLKINYNIWRNAKSEDVLQYLDPSPFINDEQQKFQFLDLAKPVQISVQVLNQYLKGKGVLEGKGQVFLDAANKYGINVVYLVAHALLETGNGTSALARGIMVNGKTVHNVYGIGANDSNPNGLGAKTAYENGWFSVEQAISGGAQWIYTNYLKVGQNTLYEMRWNPLSMATNRYASHQYATDIGWAYKQIKSLYNIMIDVYKIQPFTIYLEVPIYK